MSLIVSGEVFLKILTAILKVDSPFAANTLDKSLSNVIICSIKGIFTTPLLRTCCKIVNPEYFF